MAIKLRLVQKTRAMKSRIESAAPTVIMADDTETYTEKLEKRLLELLTRTEEEADAEVANIISHLRNVEDVATLRHMTQTNYGTQFFKNEVDSEFKRKLCRGLINLYAEKNAGEPLPLWVGIVSLDINFIDYFAVNLVGDESDSDAEESYDNV